MIRRLVLCSLLLVCIARADDTQGLVIPFKQVSVSSPVLQEVIEHVLVEEGEAVDRVEKLLDVVNIDQIYVQFYLDPKMMQSIKQDAEIPVRFPVIGNQDFSGKVSFIDPRIDAGSGLFRVKVLIENQDHHVK